LVVTEPKERIAEWVFKNIHGGTAPSVDVAIGLIDGNDLIAGVAFTDYNGRSIGMHVAAGKKNWLSKDFLWAAFFLSVHPGRRKENPVSDGLAQ